MLSLITYTHTQIMKKPTNLVRIYPGIREDQKEFIKKESKKENMGHGEFIRHMIDTYQHNK